MTMFSNIITHRIYIVENHVKWDVTWLSNKYGIEAVIRSYF